MRVEGWGWDDVPTWEHDCDKCTFLFSLTLLGAHESLKTVDVYESCQKDRGDRWIIRYSSEGSDYATTDLKTLAAYYVIGHFGDLEI